MSQIEGVYSEVIEKSEWVAIATTGPDGPLTTSAPHAQGNCAFTFVGFRAGGLQFARA